MSLPLHFVIGHSDGTAFKIDSLRDYSTFCDLDVAEAPRGLAHAHRSALPRCSVGTLVA